MRRKLPQSAAAPLADPIADSFFDFIFSFFFCDKRLCLRLSLNFLLD
jgi:hypothetical protein